MIFRKELTPGGPGDKCFLNWQSSRQCKKYFIKYVLLCWESYTLNLVTPLFLTVQVTKWKATENNFNKQLVVLTPHEWQEKQQVAFFFSNSFKIQILQQALLTEMHRPNSHPSWWAAQKGWGTEHEEALLPHDPYQTHCRDAAFCEAEVSSLSSMLQVICHSKNMARVKHQGWTK